MKKGLHESTKRFRREIETNSRRRRAVNVSIDVEVLKGAKALGLNLSQTLESELRRLTQAARQTAWADENKAAMEEHNRFIEENGIWSEEFRSW
jgi:antitoxin CcdA